MSRGPGRIERSIRALFDLHPDLAFITDDLVEHCFPSAGSIERKHRVSVLRAAHSVIAADPNWREMGRGGQCGVFVNLDNLQSYALGKLALHYLGSTKWWCATHSPEDRLAWFKTEPHLTCMTPPDGEWVRRVLWHRAERDGNVELAATFRTEHQARYAASMAQLRAISR